MAEGTAGAGAGGRDRTGHPTREPRAAGRRAGPAAQGLAGETGGSRLGPTTTPVRSGRAPGHAHSSSKQQSATTVRRFKFEAPALQSARDWHAEERRHRALHRRPTRRGADKATFTAGVGCPSQLPRTVGAPLTSESVPSLPGGAPKHTARRSSASRSALRPED